METGLAGLIQQEGTAPQVLCVWGGTSYPHKSSFNGEWDFIVQWIQNFCLDDEKLLEMDGGDCCTRL